MIRKFTFLIFLAFIISTDALACGGQSCGAHDCDSNRASFVSTKPRSGNWLNPNFPKEGWSCLGMEDLGKTSLRCEMCKREDIRYVHKMAHSEAAGTLSVGCICAGHMEGDEDNAKQRHKDLLNRARRIDNRIKKAWKIAPGGQLPFMILKDRRTNKKVLVKIVVSRLCEQYDIPEKYTLFIDEQYDKRFYTRAKMPQSPRRLHMMYTALNNAPYFREIKDAQKAAIETLRTTGVI